LLCNKSKKDIKFVRSASDEVTVVKDSLKLLRQFGKYWLYNSIGLGEKLGLDGILLSDSILILATAALTGESVETKKKCYSFSGYD
jgi:hypothetical protein